MFNKKRIVVIVSFIILSFVLITYGATRRGAAKLDVTFIDGYNDKVIDEQVINYEGDAKVPDEPKHENYVFGGWYLYGSEDTLVKNFKKLTEDLKVEARYKADKNNNGIADDEDTYYDVRFIDGVTNEVQKTESVLVGLGATAPTPNTHFGYTFIGWDKDYSNITSNLDVNSNYSNDTTPITMYTLRFFNKEGDLITTQSIASGNASASVDVPVYVGHTFNGWYEGTNGTGASFIVGSIITRNIDIYGYWTKNNYEVIVDPNKGELIGGSDPTLEKEVIEYEGKYTLPVAQRNYTLTYHENGDNVLINGTKVVTKPANLLGWCEGTTDTCSDIDLITPGTEVTIKDNIKYTAKWGNAKTETTVIDATRTQTESTIYTFDGWSLTQNGTKAYDKDEKITLTGNMDLYAMWKESVRQYTVGLVGDIDSSNNPSNLTSSQKLDYDTEITMPNSNKSYILAYNTNGGKVAGTELENRIFTLNVKFLGWCSNKDASCKNLLKTGSKAVVKSDETFAAKHATNSDSTTVLGATKTDKVNTYEFLGWSTTENGSVDTNYNVGKEITLTEDVTLYAVYKSTAIDYTLTLDPNGGTIAKDDEIKTTYGYNDKTETFPTPTKKYTLTYNTNGGTAIANRIVSAKFVGWCEGTTDTCTTYATSATMDANKTYTAKWTTSEEAIKLPGAVKTSVDKVYTFKEWYYGTPEVTLKKEYNLYLSGDLTINARYDSVPRQYDVKLVGNIDSNNNPSNLTANQKLDYDTEITMPNSNKSYTLTYNAKGGKVAGTELETKTETLKVDFLGWCSNKDNECKNLFKTGSKVVVKSDETFTAKHAVNSASTIILGATKTDKVNTYEFLGWSTTENGGVDTNYNVGKEISLTKDVTLYAVYKSTAIDYTLTLDPNGGTIAKDDEIKTTYGYNDKTETFPTPTKKYTLTYNTNGGTVIANRIVSAKFVGWCEGTTDTCTTYATNATMDANKTYTAKWTTSEEAIKLPGAVKDLNNGIKYTFKEWYYGTPEVTMSKDFNLYLSSNLTITARYDESAVVTLDSDVEEGTEGGIIDTPTSNPNELDEGDNTFETGTKITLPNVTNYYILKYEIGEGSLLNGAKARTDVEATLLGWCSKSTCTSEELLAPGTIVTVEKDITYKAVWGEAKEAITIAYANKTDNNEFDYTFDGWALSATGDVNGTYNLGKSITLTDSLTLYAKYSSVKQKYDATINGTIDTTNNPDNLIEGDNTVDHGTVIEMPGAIHSYKLTYHSGIANITSPNVTQKVSAQFLGWCAGKTDCTVAELIKKNAKQTIVSNITYNAMFGEAIDTIKIVGSSDLSDDYNTYTFVGWSTTPNGTVETKYNVNKEITLSSDLDLYAVYKSTAIDYTLTLNPNGGVIADADKISTTYGYGETTSTFPIPTKSFTLTYNTNGGTAIDSEVISATFLGWCEGTTDTCTTYVTSATMDANKTYTAKWQENGKTLPEAVKTSVDKVYTFEEWYYGNPEVTKEAGDVLYLTSDLTINARYTDSVRYYNVCFDSAYDKTHLPETQSKAYDSLVDPVSDLSSTEHTFMGWTTSNGTSWNFSTDKVLNDVNLYAKWNNKVEFETNGGSVTGTTPDEYQNENATITLPNANKTYTLTYYENGGTDLENPEVDAQFLGWCKNSVSCDTKLQPGTTDTVTANTKYYAVWGDATSNITLASTTKAADNYNTYELAGWSTTEDGDVNYAAGYALTISSDTNLYAVWTPTAKEYTLTLNSNGGTIAEDDEIPTTYEYNETISSLPTPTRNYTLTYNTNGGTAIDSQAVSAQFAGWCEGTTDTCTTYATSATMNGNKTYTAKWAASTTAIVLPEAVKTSIDKVYTFKEWYYGTPEVKMNKDFNLYLSSDLTINARYTDSTRNYTVVFENNGLGTKPGNQTVGFGSYAIDPGALVETGYTFDNWYKENTFTTPWNFAVDTVNGNTIAEDGNVHIYGKMDKNNYKLHITVTGETATYNVNYTLGSDNKYVVPFNDQVNITNINPTNGYYVSGIKVNDVLQTITSGTHTFTFNMPAENTHVEIILTKLTNDEIGKVSPIRLFYIESSWVDVRLNQIYMNKNGETDITVKECTSYYIWGGCRKYENKKVSIPVYDSTNFKPDLYYSTTHVDPEAFLLNPTGTYSWRKYEYQPNDWDQDISQGEMENLAIDGGWHYHLDNIYKPSGTSLSDYKYFYVVYVENGYRYIIEYKRTTGNNYTIENFFSIKIS